MTGDSKIVQCHQAAAVLLLHGGRGVQPGQGVGDVQLLQGAGVDRVN